MVTVHTALDKAIRDALTYTLDHEKNEMAEAILAASCKPHDGSKESLFDTIDKGACNEVPLTKAEHEKLQRIRNDAGYLEKETKPKINALDGYNIPEPRDAYRQLQEGDSPSCEVIEELDALRDDTIIRDAITGKDVLNPNAGADFDAVVAEGFLQCQTDLPDVRGEGSAKLHKGRQV